ncbi:hypothetical protein F4W70_07125 [Pseudomonas cannabina]|nr:hypothetical protein F4W70_07125 [Pseudomonas cannabina]
MILPAGRGSGPGDASLARELPGTGSKVSARVQSDATWLAGFAAGPRQFADKSAPTRNCGDRYSPGTNRKTPSVCSATSFSLKRCGRYSPFTNALA